MGKIKEQIDGRYMIDFVKKINGKRIHISKRNINTYQEAERMISILIEEKSKTNRYDKGTFGSFYEEYIKYRSHKVGDSTLIAIRSIRNVIFKEHLEMNIYEVISMHNIIHLYKTIINRNDVGEKYKNRVINEMRQMIDYASLMKIISNEEGKDYKSILENILVNKKNKEKEYYTSAQMNRFINNIDDENDKDMFITFSYLGCRISEFLGLTWDCFDKKNKVIEIKQQILYGNRGKAILTDKLKTKESYRKCKLNNVTYGILLKRMKISSTGFIFPKDSFHVDEPISKTTLRRKMIKYMKHANLPIISPHGFRHSKATLFMSVCKNMDEVKAASKFLGHSVSMMMETYSHAEEKTIDRLIRRMEK